MLIGRSEAVLAGKDAPAVRMKLVGVDPRSSVEGMDKLAGKVNYFIGNDPKQWRRGLAGRPLKRTLPMLWPGPA